MQDNRPPRWQLEYPAGIHVESRYNADGLRTKKTVTQSGASTVYEYLWNESRLVGQKVGNDAVRILYDANDEPVGFTVNDSASYFYVKNLQGDVLSIVDKTGAEKVSYVYDAYGQIVSMTGDATLQKLNPCTYRGYYYDAETGLYYLQSRYYNPEWGRFINADIIEILQLSKEEPVNANLFSYCNSNPVLLSDHEGHFALSGLVGTLAFIALIYVVAYATFAAGVVATSVLTRAPRISMPRTSTPSVTILRLLVSFATITYVTAKTKVKRKIREFNYQYFEAELINRKVIIGKGISFSQAKRRVDSERNVMCIKKSAAFALAKQYRKSVGPERSGGEGFFWHYHKNRGSKAHIWYVI